MTLFGWMIFSVLSLTSIFFLVQLIRDFIWNHKLSMFQKSQGIHMVKKPFLFWAKRSYGFLIATLFVVTVSFSGVFSVPNMLGERILISAKPVQSEAALRALLSQTNQHTIWDFMFPERAQSDDLIDSPGVQEGEALVDREVIGTNTQVDGVDEADILKTSKDGKTIYYASRYFNRIRIMQVDDQGIMFVDADLDLDDLYVDGMYLTDNLLIIIGYTLDMRPYIGQAGREDMAIGWYDYHYSGTIRVYDRQTLEAVYEMQTDTSLYHHRLIEDNLFVVSNKYLNQQDELRPQFSETKHGLETNSFLEYEDIYYFEGVSVHSMTILLGIKLSTFEVTSQAFLGQVDEIYASENALFTVHNYYDYKLNYVTEQLSHVIQYDLDLTNASFKYVGQATLEGHIRSPYWMDQYEGHLRVVTASFWPTKNRLFILKPHATIDRLEIVGQLTEDLGKIDETVKSVRFNKGLAYVVTFIETDPLYTIDLSNPKKPAILSYEEEPGYSVYLHVWGQDNHLIGLGLAEDLRTLKISAYITATGEPVDTYFIGPKDDSLWHYGYSEALWNPKAILVDATLNIFAFPVMTWQELMVTDSNGYHSKYSAHYYIFRFDFEQENPEDIISDPIIISHEELGYYTPIERGTYISFSDGTTTQEIIYTFSYQQMISYDLATLFDSNAPTYKQVINFTIEP